MKHIFLDTSIFISENFFTGRKLNRLGMLGNQERINLYITSVVEGELIENIKKQSKEVQKARDRFMRDMENKLKIVKNVHSTDNIIHLSKNLEEDLISKFERFKDFSKIQVIYPNRNFRINKILDDYFNQNPPFHSKSKKSEFPDAISFSIIEDFASTKKLELIHISKDGDFANLNIKSVRQESDLNVIIKSLNELEFPENIENETSALEFIPRYVNQYLELITYEIQLEILVHFMMNFNEGLELSTEDIRVNNLKIKTYEITEIQEGLMTFQCAGIYETTVPQIINSRIDANYHKKLLEQFEYKMSIDKTVKLTGEFKITFYYDFEYPYEMVPNTLEIDEDEKKVKSIVSMK